MKQTNPAAAMRRLSAMALGIALAIAIFSVRAQAAPAGELAAIPPNKDTDLKFYQADGKIQQGAAALEHMTSDANLVVWVAGNQFFAMDDVIGAFQKAYPGISVGLITLPPGLILAAIEARRLELQRPGISLHARRLCVGQSRASATAQGSRADARLQDLHA